MEVLARKVRKIQRKTLSKCLKWIKARLRLRHLRHYYQDLLGLKSVSEVQVTRRLYSSGESEFFINRVPCRLKDLKEFFRAIGLGARAYTIVAQGEVSRIVTSKPEERRLMIEDAAGVLGFRDKIASANRRLKETELKYFSS